MTQQHFPQRSSSTSPGEIELVETSRQVGVADAFPTQKIHHFESNEELAGLTAGLCNTQIIHGAGIFTYIETP